MCGAPCDFAAKKDWAKGTAQTSFLHPVKHNCCQAAGCRQSPAGGPSTTKSSLKLNSNLLHENALHRCCQLLVNWLESVSTQAPDRNFQTSGPTSYK